ncbi:hypothetical protein GW17_00025896 [Ensete ventricosum]|nr:hypothetical protein GW17_00025896 [Ensete ventricosum]RZR78095.1 hypothetical protein BHM03_00003342 [Ensete ventricosum]
MAERGALDKGGDDKLLLGAMATRAALRSVPGSSNLYPTAAPKPLSQSPATLRISRAVKFGSHRRRSSARAMGSSPSSQRPDQVQGQWYPALCPCLFSSVYHSS